MTGDFGLTFAEHTGMPLGGLGTGSFELRPNGHFHEWQIMNNKPWGNGPATTQMEDEGLFFALAANDGQRSRVLMLNRPRWGDFNPSLSWESLRWTMDPYHMPWMEFPREIDFDGRYPEATLEYVTDAFPIKVALKAMSPFIPLDEKNSGLPLALLTFTVENLSRTDQRVSLAGALKNCVGYDHEENESCIRYSKASGMSFLSFSRKGLPQGAQSDGGMSFGLWSKKRGRTSYVLHAIHPRDIYDPVMATGRLEDLDRSDFSGAVGNDLGGPAVRKDAPFGLSRGVLCRTMTLAPREKVDVTFSLAWFFPNMSQPLCRDKTCRNMEIIGHKYATWFKSADDVLLYGKKRFEYLTGRTLEFVDAFYSTSRPRWLLDAVNAQLTTLPKSSWWDASGRFAIWEGLGCCGLQTPDITLYGSFPIVQFFPEVQKSQMELPTVTAETAGRPPHLFRGSFATTCLYPNNRIDNSPQFILLVWRDVMWTGDLDFARRMWPFVETFLADIEATDTDGDGLPNNAGVDQTYDQFPLFGTSAYVGLEYIGALLGASEIAGALKLTDRADELEAKARRALATLEEQLWNGDYYNLSYNGETKTGNKGCMADQICGDWFVRQTGGKGLLSAGRAVKAMKSVLKHCSRDGGYLANCDWPRGGLVPIRRETSDQANCPWSGVEYAVAAEMILLGLSLIHI